MRFKTLFRKQYRLQGAYTRTASNNELQTRSTFVFQISLKIGRSLTRNPSSFILQVCPVYRCEFMSNYQRLYCTLCIHDVVRVVRLYEVIVIQPWAVQHEFIVSRRLEFLLVTKCYLSKIFQMLKICTQVVIVFMLVRILVDCWGLGSVVRIMISLNVELACFLVLPVVRGNETACAKRCLHILLIQS